MIKVNEKRQGKKRRVRVMGKTKREFFNATKKVPVVCKKCVDKKLDNNNVDTERLYAVSKSIANNMKKYDTAFRILAK